MSEGSSPMKNLLFGAPVIMMMMVISSAVAYATPGDNWADRPDECKSCPSWRSPASSKAPPVVRSAFPVCHLVKERVGTHNGHAVYRTLQVCG
jgi:hypothetical protein